MALYVIGYPLGGVIGGSAAQTWLLQIYDWRAVFLFGAVVTAAMILRPGALHQNAEEVALTF